MECNFSGVRDSPANRADFAVSFRAALTTFLSDHYFAQLQSCTVGLSPTEVGSTPVVWPNPAEAFGQVDVRGEASGGLVRIVDACGREVRAGTTGVPIEVGALAAGTYMVRMVTAARLCSSNNGHSG